MNKKLIIMLAAVATAGVMFARPGPGFHGGPRGFHGGFRGGPPPMRYHGGYHHHRHHCGWGVAGAVLGTAALVHDIVRPAPIFVAPAPVYAPPPVVVSPAPVVVPPPPPVVTYPTYYRTW